MERGSFEHLKWLKTKNSPDVYFILRLRFYGQIGVEESDIELARIFNIPKCCSDFFIKLKRLGISPGLYMDRKFGKDSDFDKFGYVRCPACRLNERR